MSPDAARINLDTLFEATDARLARGDEAFEVRDSRIALVLGVVHGLGLEQVSAAGKSTAVAAARAGYAFRRAEEDAGLVTGTPALRDLMAALEEERSDLLHWEAMQISAWELVDDPRLERFADLVDTSTLAGHPRRDEALGLLATAAHESFGTGTPIGSLSASDGRRAARFGYALRMAEQSLPDDPKRLLRDV